MTQHNSAKPHISIVIPVYGCRECLDSLCHRLTRALKTLEHTYEIILVDDGCPQESWNTIQQLPERHSGIRAIRLSRNFGQHNAITAGLDRTLGEWVVVMDCDLQDQPEEIVRLYQKAQDGYDYVVAKRASRKDGVLKKLGSKAFYSVLSYLTDVEHDESIANFGIYHRKVIEAVKSLREGLRYFPVMVRWVGFHGTAIEVDHGERELGETSYTFSKLLSLALNVMLAFSDKPLRLTVKLGLMISFSAVLVSFMLFLASLFRIWSVEGWASIMMSLWFLFGVLVCVLGVVGLYVGKVFDEVKDRPLYLVKDEINP